MEIASRWIEKYRFEVTNNRHSPVILDVPPTYGGEDIGPTALELAIMALSACLGTTYKMIADRMQLNISKIEVKASADKTNEDKTVTNIKLLISVNSDSPKEKLQKCLELAEENCPVDLIFKQTDIPIETKLEIN